ncbi:hypothetical protein [Kribbella sp. CA-294648]|uniref:hypothetical protein n=1 Tax=Kribbella sp. CA-294648 TaxID=3239948 RepID=UPI003D8D54C4
MNQLLKDHGYLYGEPGAYRLTEKGQQYGEEQYHSRGTGGYAHYNRNWETRTWSDETAAALTADMEASPVGIHAGPEKIQAVEYVPFDGDGDDGDDGGDDEPQLGWTEIGISAAMIGALLVAPRVKPFWDSKVKPAAKELRERLAKQEARGSSDS